MNNVKTQFSIKDLENLSGIKAHTIRIWEKRYQLLSPSRTNTNIRYYNLTNLQLLLNVTFLYNNGYKISKISELPPEEIKHKCREIISAQAKKNLFINDVKLAMLNFDQMAFEDAYQKLINTVEFREVFVAYFIPFLEEIGLLWHTDTITPAHEHFITALIKQKIMVQTERVQMLPPIHTNDQFVLFLPDHEIHELGLLYANYEIIKNGYPTIYLGQSIPINSLKLFLNNDKKIIFVTYSTVEPMIDKIPEYLDNLNETILSNCHSELWVLGRNLEDLSAIKHFEKIKFHSMPSLIKHLQNNSLVEA
ncbi:MerR family transcriptional regulator [Flavobacteriaceae bacterium F08102]|nr:MerR family transcriptional regulator [Flavobacteriaceae bacterium F08102]